MLKKYIGDGDFWRVTLRLAVPIALQNLLISSFVLVDTLMVGQLGDLALSSVGMAGQFSWFLNMVLFGICSGASVFIAQFWGIKDMAGIRRTYGIALISAVLLSAVFCAIAALFPESVIMIFNKDPGVVLCGSEYLRIAAWSYMGIAINNVMSIVLRTTERVKLPMYAALFTTVLNGILDYCLIFGAFGLPEMGVRGAALATCISAWAGPVIVLGVSLLQDNVLNSPPRDILRFSFADIAAYYRKASPVILNETMWGLGTVIFNVLFANLGYENYAAVTIFRTFENISFVFFIGLCSACSIMIGKSVGAGKIRRAMEDSLRFAVVVPLFSFVIGMLIVAFRAQLAAVFNLSGTISSSVLLTTTWLLMIYGAELTVRNIPYIMVVGIFRSGGDTVTGAKLDLFSLWLCSIPATIAAALWLKLPFPAVFAIMYLAEDYLKLFLCIRHFRSKRWLRPVTDEGRAGLEEYLAEEAR